MQRVLIVLSLFVCWALGACAGGAGDREPLETSGSVTLPLQASAPSGNVYQLRNAVFDIQGPTTTTLQTSAATDPNPTLSATLLAGSYSITLRPGWSLFRVSPGTPQAVAGSLTSANPAAFTVAGGGQTNVGFAFFASDEPVDFSTGTVNVGITVNEDGGAPPASRTLSIALAIEGDPPSGGGSPRPGRVTSSPAGIDCGPTTSQDGPSCQANFAGGSTVTLTAVGTSILSFAGWRGSCGGTQPTTTVTMSQAQDCTAVFVAAPGPLPIRLNLNFGGALSSGSVVSSPTGIQCGSGGTQCQADFGRNTVVSFTATPNPGFQFTGWGNDCVGSGPSTFYVMTGNRNPAQCDAIFAPVTTQVPLTVNVSGSGRVTSSPAGISQCGAPSGEDCTQSYPSGQMVTLTASPGNLQSTFAGWSGSCSGTTTTTTVAMNQAATCTASFTGMVTVNFVVMGSGQVTNSSPPLSCTSTGGTCMLQEALGSADTVNASVNATWSGSCATPTAQNSRTIDFTRDGTCTVTFP